MTTKFIGIKKFIDNLTSLAKEAAEKNIRYIITFRNKPILEAKASDQLILKIAHRKNNPST